MVSAIPADYPRLTPYLTVTDGAAAIQFYSDVFGAVERLRLPTPTGGVGHAELLLGESLVMLAEKDPMIGNKTPRDYGGSPVSLTLYVEDVDATVAKAAKHGAKVVQEPADQFYGDRSGIVEDPFGHVWAVMTHVEDVSPEQLQERMAAMFEATPPQ